MKFYRVRDKNTGLFSTGGVRPRWTKGGKVWQKSHLKNHLRQHVDFSESNALHPSWSDYPSYTTKDKDPEYEEKNRRWREQSRISYAKQDEIKSHWWDFLPENWEAVEVNTDEVVPVREICRPDNELPPVPDYLFEGMR